MYLIDFLLCSTSIAHFDSSAAASSGKSRTFKAGTKVLPKAITHKVLPLASSSPPPPMFDEKVLTSEAGVLYKTPSVECSSIKRTTLASLPHMNDEESENWDHLNMVCVNAVSVVLR